MEEGVWKKMVAKRNIRKRGALEPPGAHLQYCTGQDSDIEMLPNIEDQAVKIYIYIFTAFSFLDKRLPP